MNSITSVLSSLCTRLVRGPILFCGVFLCLFFAHSAWAAPIVPNSFSTTWDTNGPIVIDLGVCPSAVYWEEIGNPSNNGTSTVCVGSNQTITFPSDGQYRVDFSGNFTRIDLDNVENRDMFRTVEQWGNSVWQDMSHAFDGVDDLVFNAADTPDLSNVTNMSYMFASAGNFNSNINNWDVSNVTHMTSLFYNAAAFNQPLNNWDVSSVTDMRNMFTGPWFSSSAFNQPLNNWDVSSVTDMSFMFQWATSFNQDISSWNVSSVTNMDGMFDSVRVFNQPLNSWDVSSVTSMSSMFFSHQPSNFNQPLNSWNVSNVTNMQQLFDGATSFNQDISSWNVSGVTSMSRMFARATAFNQPLNSWNVSNVTNMSNMFLYATAFNQPLNNWDVSNAGSLSAMFANATAFNQPLNNWNVSDVTYMDYMFNGATTFNQDLSVWNISNVTDMSGMFDNSKLSQTNYANILQAWSAQAVQSAVPFGAVGRVYESSAQTGRDILTGTYGWTITDAGQYVEPPNHVFITRWDTRLDSNTANELEIYASNGSAYNFFIDWGDGTVEHYPSDPGGYINHTYSTPGIKTVIITGNFPYFYSGGDDSPPQDKLIDVVQWGTTAWEGLYFADSNYLTGFSATDVPDVSNITDMSYIFADANSFNGDVSDWDVSNVTNMDHMFYGATVFNQRLDTWNISNVTNMTDMLVGTAFTEAKYTRLLNSWSLLSVQPDVYFETDVQYCGATAQAARDILTNAPNNWVITDGGATADCVIEAEEEVKNSSGSSGTRIGDRIKSYFATSSAPVVTVTSFMQSVRHFLDYLTRNEADLDNLTPAESTKIIVGLREIIAYLLKLLPGV